MSSFTNFYQIWNNVALIVSATDNNREKPDTKYGGIRADKWGVKGDEVEENGTSEKNLHHLTIHAMITKSIFSYRHIW